MNQLEWESQRRYDALQYCSHDAIYSCFLLYATASFEIQFFDWNTGAQGEEVVMSPRDNPSIWMPFPNPQLKVPVALDKTISYTSVNFNLLIWYD